MSGDDSTDGDWMGKAPAFQFYAADFVIGTMDLSLAEIGAYVKLLAFSWDKGPVPFDETQRARWIGVPVKDMRKLWATLQSKFTETPDGFINERLEEQRAEREAFVKSKADAGRRSGESRRTNREQNVNTSGTEVEQDPQRKRTLQSSDFDLQTSDQVRGNQHARASNLVNGSEQRRHGSHAWCDNERGKCVPFGLHEDFIKALGLGHAVADLSLKAWYPTVLAKYADRPIGDDLFTFWRNEFAAWVGTVSLAPASQKQGRAEKIMSAAERVIAKQLEHQKAVTDGR